MGRRRRREEEALAQILAAGIREGEQRAFGRVLLSTAAATLGREVDDVAALVASVGVEDALRMAGTAAREVWPERWRAALSGPLSAVMQAATEGAAPVLGSFDLANPRMRDYLGRYTSELAETLSGTSYENFEKALREAMDEGLSVPDAAARLRERVGDLNATRSELIARNETLRASKGASRMQARESGVVRGKKRHTAGDSRVRPEHAAINGEERGIDEPYSNGEQFCGELSVQCRCYDEYLLDWDTIRGLSA